jgi:hypothetical protein
MSDEPENKVAVQMMVNLKVTPRLLAWFLRHADDEGTADLSAFPGIAADALSGLLGERIEHPAQEELPLSEDELPPLTNVPQAAPQEAPQAPVEEARSDRPAPVKRAPRASKTAPVAAKPNGVHGTAELEAAVVETPPYTPPVTPSEEELRAVLVVLANKAPGRNQTVIQLLEEVGGAPKLLQCPVDKWPAILDAAQSAIEVFGG